MSNVTPDQACTFALPVRFLVNDKKRNSIVESVASWIRSPNSPHIYCPRDVRYVVCDTNFNWAGDNIFQKHILTRVSCRVYDL